MRRGLALAGMVTLMALMISACGTAAPTANESEPARSEAQEAMVDRQLFAPQFPNNAPQAPTLQAPLGNPGAAPLGSGALFN